MGQNVVDQYLFQIIVAVAAAFGGWVLNTISSSLKTLDADVRNIPQRYVQKEDFNKALAELKADLSNSTRDLKNDMQRGFDKIDASVTTLFERLNERGHGE